MYKWPKWECRQKREADGSKSTFQWRDPGGGGGWILRDLVLCPAHQHQL